MNNSGALVIGWDFSEENVRDTLIIMQGDRNNRMKIINVFYDQDARDIYEMLIEKKGNL